LLGIWVDVKKELPSMLITYIVNKLYSRALDMTMMIRCIMETSCAVSAAAQLSPLFNRVDLDGDLHINNKLFG
jgi:hypothetical protein